MKVKDLVAKLLTCDQEAEAMARDLYRNESIWAIQTVKEKVVTRDNEYPKDFNMPKGYKYVELYL